MAIVFISPKQKQKTVIKIILILLVLLLVIGSLVILIPKFLNATPSAKVKVSFSKPDVIINLDILNSEKVKNLNLFSNLETEFVYVVKNQQGKLVTGNILALTPFDAQNLLEESGFKVVSLKEVNIGRSEPFTSYYQSNLKAPIK